MEDILEDCRLRDRNAQRQLFYAFAPQMLAVCTRYVKVKEDAEERMLQGFEKFFAQIDSFSFRGEAAFTAYLKRIMVNECLMLLRKRRIVFEEMEDQDFVMVQEETALERLSAKEIFELILKLPEGYATVFNLFVVEDLSHKEIAQLLGITEGTSKSQLSKARSLLQQMMRTHER
ncbi:RNA polymerase sigma factor [Niabella hirudinis]|uniref:RNA polymerase sigma factor n=1 Tax=Niabella hirudinis TaxID=1285929 RepID=UPI003EC0D2AE